ncbi:hypothetical protein FA13DRAFT_1716709 [Coprinellus micaceus]|uniref:RING-type domain-containing protein n=1 Tax=Coprinellus micaceus TaxID=71717 RepID=A0A4Y7SK50_COPMI|nr:hypothetical protein FA13DRAFT_1716709 [Coprinellus micaceus]
MSKVATGPGQTSSPDNASNVVRELRRSPRFSSASQGSNEERAPRRSPRFTNTSSAASQHSQPTPSERQRRNQTQPHEPVQRTGSPSTSVAQAQSTSDSTHGQQRPTLIHRTYAVPHRTYRSESMASLSTIVSTSSKGLPTIAEILAEIRAAADARRRTEDEERGRVALEQMVRLVKDNGTCGICGDYMRNPFLTECGHAYCSGCLRGWFETQLRDNLSPYAAHNHHSLHHRGMACQRIPTSIAQLDALKNALQEHGCRIRSIFRYSCPDCRATSSKIPVRDYALQELLEGARHALGRLLEVNVAPQSSVTPFQGLFLS